MNALNVERTNIEESIMSIAAKKNFCKCLARNLYSRAMLKYRKRFGIVLIEQYWLLPKQCSCFQVEVYLQLSAQA